MVKYLLPVLCGLALLASSCKVDCEWTCTASGLSDIEGTSKVNSDDCDDCDFFAVNTYKTTGYDCECSQ